MKIAGVGGVMRNNKLIKKIFVILIIFIIMIVFDNIEIFARSNFSENNLLHEDEILITELSDTKFKDPTEDPNFWDPSKDEKGQEKTYEEPELMKKAGILLGVINVLGVVSAVIALVLLGMKYFLGSVQEKAEFKNSLLPYILGIVLLVSCTTLPNIIFNVSQGVFK